MTQMWLTERAFADFKGRNQGGSPEIFPPIWECIICRCWYAEGETCLHHNPEVRHWLEFYDVPTSERGPLAAWVGIVAWTGNRYNIWPEAKWVKQRRGGWRIRLEGKGIDVAAVVAMLGRAQADRWKWRTGSEFVDGGQ